MKENEKGKTEKQADSGNIKNENAGFWERFLPEPFENYPDAVKRRILDIITTFVLGGILLLVLLLVAGAGSYWYLGAVICVFGTGMAARIAFMASNGRLKETEGVITGMERAGYRMQKSYLLIQTMHGAVYRVISSDNRKRYREGNIVRFYTTPESLCHLRDGEYVVNVVYAMERISAKVTSDDEDEKILAAEKGKIS